MVSGTIFDNWFLIPFIHYQLFEIIFFLFYSTVLINATGPYHAKGWFGRGITKITLDDVESGYEDLRKAASLGYKQAVKNGVRNLFWILVPDTIYFRAYAIRPYKRLYPRSKRRGVLNTPCEGPIQFI